MRSAAAFLLYKVGAVGCVGEKVGSGKNSEKNRKKVLTIVGRSGIINKLTGTEENKKFRKGAGKRRMKP